MIPINTILLFKFINDSSCTTIRVDSMSSIDPNFIISLRKFYRGGHHSYFKNYTRAKDTRKG